MKFVTRIILSGWKGVQQQLRTVKKDWQLQKRYTMNIIIAAIKDTHKTFKQSKFYLDKAGRKIILKKKRTNAMLCVCESVCMMRTYFIHIKREFSFVWCVFHGNAWPKYHIVRWIYYLNIWNGMLIFREIVESKKKNGNIHRSRQSV